MRLLFITWDGPESTYHETLFIPILAKARATSDSVHMMQFAWNAEGRSQRIARAASEQGMFYTAHEIQRHYRIFGTAAALMRGTASIVTYSRSNAINVLMPRSPLVAAMALGALPFLPPSTRLIYDADGLVADERVDFGGWSRWAPPYRTFRAFEHCVLRRADAVLARSHFARETLARRARDEQLRDRIVVVHNGSDPQRFTPSTREERTAARLSLRIDAHAPLLVYAGSLGGKYRLDSMLRLFSAVQRRLAGARMLILTNMPEVAQHTLALFSELRDTVQVLSAAPSDVPRLLAAADLGLAIIEPSLSMRAVSPIKIGEYLQCGLPVVATEVGDLRTQLDRQTSFILKSPSDLPSIESAADWFVRRVLPDRDGFRARCRERGMTTFSLQRTADAYREAYGRALSQ